jgi:hypothetical protein
VQVSATHIAAGVVETAIAFGVFKPERYEIKIAKRANLAMRARFFTHLE